MTDPQRAQLFIVAWAFVVKAEHRRPFERAYGPNGDWVRLFRSGEGYLKTELHRDPEKPARYITLDFWRSCDHYQAFRERAKSAYREIDANCERFTEHEELLGEFAELASLHAAFPALGPETQVPPTHTFRAAGAVDIPEILRLEQAAILAAHWTPAAYDAIFQGNAPARIALVAENSERCICGFVLARIIADECELENIVVGGGEARQGMGSALVQDLVQAARGRGAKRIFLEVRESNLAARGLYEKLGFHCDGERAAYYSDPVEKAILYSRTL